MRHYRADLHIHTVLSACAEIEMIPPLIVEEALFKGLDVIAITDHNSCGNVAAVQQAAAGTTLTVIPGMELQTREEIDIICLFDTLAQALAWQTWVEPQLIDLPNDANLFGPQYCVDAAGDFVEEDGRMLQAPSLISLEDAVDQIHRMGGLAIPAHIDRAAGVMRTLGIWPSDLDVFAVEVSWNMRPSQARQKYQTLPDIAVISNSDAHWLDWIAKVITMYECKDVFNIAELKLALCGQHGRSYHVP